MFRIVCVFMIVGLFRIGAVLKKKRRVVGERRRVGEEEGT